MVSVQVPTNDCFESFHCAKLRDRVGFCSYFSNLQMTHFSQFLPPLCFDSNCNVQANVYILAQLPCPFVGLANWRDPSPFYLEIFCFLKDCLKSNSCLRYL